MTDRDRIKQRLGEIAASLPTEENNASATARKIDQLIKERDDLNTVIALENAKESVAALEGKLAGRDVKVPSTVQKVENKGKGFLSAVKGIFWE